MNIQRNVHPSVSIDSVLFKRDRKLAGFTQSSFAAACGSVSIATVRRAEQGHRVIESSLRTMAKLLGQPIDRYVETPKVDDSADYVSWIEGEWISYSVEANRSLQPHIANFELYITQNAVNVSGTLTARTEADTRIERFEGCKVINNVFGGQTSSQSGGAHTGQTRFTLVVSRRNNWMDGSANWYDFETGKAETARVICVRRGCRNFDGYTHEAQVLIERELLFQKIRDLVSAGLPLEDAISVILKTEKLPETDSVD